MCIFSEKLWNFLVDYHDQYYPILKIWAFFMPAVSIRHPDDIEVKLKEIRYFRDSAYIIII